MGRLRAIDLVVCGLPIASVIGGAVRANLSPADLFLPLALVGIVFQSRHTLVPRGTVERWALYFAAVSAAMLVGLTVRVMQGEATDFGYGLAALLKLWICLGYFAAFAYYGRRLFSDDDRILRLWVRVSTVAALVGIGGVGLFIAGVITPLTTGYRAMGGFDDPNLFAAYLMLGIALTFVAATRDAVRRPTLLVAVQSIALVLTGSRAAIPALAAGVVVAIVLGRGRVVIRQLVRWVGVLAAGVAVAAWQFPTLLSLDAFSRASASVEGDVRFTLWRAAWEMWLDHPLIGIGIGQYITVSPEYVPGGLVNIPHSTHLSLLAETGAVGYALVMGLPLVVLFSVARRARATTDPTPTWLLLGIAASLAMAWTLNLENSRAMWAFLGLGLAYCRVGSDLGGVEAEAPSGAVQRLR